MSTLLSANPDANIAECSESRSFPVQERQDDHVNELKIWQNETILDEAFSFQIRHFVSTVRRRDFSKCWPFRQKILEKCSIVGLKPFLPPFEHLRKVCDNGEGEYDLQQVSSSKEDDGLGEESKGDELSNSHKEGRAPGLVEKLPTGQQDRDYVPGTNVSEESNGVHSTGADLTKSCPAQSAQEMGVTSSQRSLDNDLGAHASTSLCNMNGSDCGIGIGGHEQNASLLMENNSSLTVKDIEFQGSNENEFDSGSAVEARVCLNSVKGGPVRIIQQQKSKSLFNESPASEEQVGSLKSKSSKVRTLGQFETQLSSDRLTLDHTTALCTDRNTGGLPPRLERNCRNGDDSSFTGLNLDALVPQVCPVCLNFTSTSNTALNAHIDHCLESVLPGEKGESRVNKHRIKPRKMRSMVDICATAPTRTLEDLERSSKLWALNNETPKEESSCSPSWTGGLVRRQPRTSLHRGLAWKARSSLETVDTPQLSISEMQPQVEKSHGEYFIAKQPDLSGRVRETAMTLERSVEHQHLTPEEPVNATSPAMHLKQITVPKKKKKRGLTNAISSREIVMPEECNLLSKEDGGQRWLVSRDFLGFTIIDTSAEEERRLLQKIKGGNGDENEAKNLPQEDVEAVGTRSVKFSKHQLSKGPPFSDGTSTKLDHKSPNEIPKKRLRTPIESEQFLSNEETSGEDDEVVFQLPSERPVKSKKAAPKIKSLLTVVANSCKEKGKDVIEGLGSPKANELQEKSSICGINTAPSGGWSGGQEIRFKRRSLTSVQEDRREGYCELSKRARFCPEQPALSEDLRLDSLSEHGRSPKERSFSSGRAQIEDTDRPQQEMRQCPLVELDDGNLREEGLGSLTSLLSLHQVEGTNSCQIPEKRNNVITGASVKDILVKAPLCSTGISDLREIGASVCTSSLIKASTTASLNEAYVDNRDEFSRKTSKGAEQTGKIHMCISQYPAVGFSDGSGSPFASFSNLNSVETDPRNRPQMLSGFRKSFFAENVTDGRPSNNLKTKQPLYDNMAASHYPMSTVKDNESARAKLAPQCYENPQSQASGIKALKDNGQPQAVSEGLEISGQCKLKCSAQHGASRAFRVGDIYERSGVSLNDIPLNRENMRILDNGNHFLMNKMDHNQRRHESTETLQRGTLSPQVPHHHQQMQLASRFLSSDSSPVILSSGSESLQGNGHVGSCDSNGLEYTPMSATSIADLGRISATDSRKLQETLQGDSGFSGEQQRTLQALYPCTNKSLTKGCEYSNLLPLQGAGKSRVPSASNGTMQRHVLHTAVQALKANTSIINPEFVNGMGGSVTVSQKVHNTLPSFSPFRRDPSTSCVNGTREGFLGAELTSNLSNYGTVEYPVDQGVVHIFGNPVFKLMGQNVIVTSNSIKALGSCNQNGVQHFHPSSSIKHLGVLPETQNHYAHNLSPEIYSSARLEAWHGDPCMSRSHSFMTDNLEIQSQALQNSAPSKSVHLKMPAHKEPGIFTPQTPMCILDDGSRSLRTTRELVMKKLAVANPSSIMSTEVFIDPSPGASSLLPSGLNRGSGKYRAQRGATADFGEHDEGNHLHVSGYKISKVVTFYDPQRRDMPCTTAESSSLVC
ncbi:hypothetical protein GOP47_0018518 [Adiantum capillus-veneris]|uniref:UBZ4-type domain-containing protein n=1 Tax=Adiantum capillus-veneris TaxID=13818 RepID=A0A9D4UEL5_ADICA|nr:hypothetical protein GOP47_0018518 [Adiantum capillus-veneris]